MTTEPGQPEHLQPRPALNGPVLLVEADPAWAAQFEAEETRTRRALGARALTVEHVGSTSVSGLAAKPVVDVVLEVPDSAAEESYVTDLEGAGYVLHLRERQWYEHRLLRRRDPDVNLHVFTAGCPEVARMLAFRDRLREHPDERDLYERTKRDLAARTWTYLQDYADAKSAVVAEVVARAEGPGAG